MRLLVSSLLLLAFALPLHAETPPPRPKLVLAVLVDQLRADYLERFHHQFGEGGFRLLMERGANLTRASYDYTPTVTGPGHASFFSGSSPSDHGIIGNDWYDKRANKPVYCVGDPTVTGIGTDTKAGQMSPRNFIGTNFSDQMRLHYRSKVVGISMKDRGAILPAGKKPVGAYWFESGSGNFISSSYYMQQLPEWAQKFNARARAAEFIGQKWTRLLDPKEYAREDDLPGEGSLSGEKAPVFDHIIAASKSEGFETIMPTPYGNQLLLEFAQAAFEGEQLGQGAQPDVFTVSFSSVDYCGHRFGPDSQEVQDIVLRLDRQIAEFFSFIDKRIGLQNVAIVLTADHGVCPTPEFAQTMGLDGQRVDTVSLLGDLMGKLSERFGTSKVLLIPRMVEENFFFDYNVLREKNIAPADLAFFIREWALGTGYFQAAYSREQILDGRTPGDLGERVRKGFHAERSGDIVLVYKPFILTGGRAGTTHGSPYAYDTHVPILFHGPVFRPGRYADDFRITDIVPTLCAALHINPPAIATGRPLVKLLAEQADVPPAPAATPRQRVRVIETK